MAMSQLDRVLVSLAHNGDFQESHTNGRDFNAWSAKLGIPPDGLRVNLVTLAGKRYVALERQGIIIARVTLQKEAYVMRLLRYLADEQGRIAKPTAIVAAYIAQELRCSEPAATALIRSLIRQGALAQSQDALHLAGLVGIFLCESAGFASAAKHHLTVTGMPEHQAESYVLGTMLDMQETLYNLERE